MNSILSSPFPCNIGTRSHILTAFFIGLFVALFLLIFEPFGISESEEEFRVLRSIGFGVVSFLVLLFFYFVVPRLFPDFFKEKTYTLGKDTISNIVLILLVGIANGVYAQFVLPDHAFASMLQMIGQTFLIGIFPLTFLSLFQYNRMLHSNLGISKEIKLPKGDKVIQHDANEDQFYTIKGEQKEAQINLKDLLFIESEGNYANLNLYENDTLVKTLYRATLKSIESENFYRNIIRCHRSFIVNLDHVTEVNGNAQGLKLSLNNCTEKIPVSRKYISTVRDYFNK